MTGRRKAAAILIAGDTPAFGRAASAVVASAGLVTARICYTTYERFRVMLTQRLIRETDLFVFELWRTYSTGLRAEGLAVAEAMIRQRVRVLVVSALSLGAEVAVPWYWDLGSKDTLPQRCGALLRRLPVGMTQGLGAAAELKRLLGAFLAMPEGHPDTVSASQ